MPALVRNPWNSPHLSTLYVIRAERGRRRIKVGISVCPEARLNSLHRKDLGRLELLAKVPCSPALERLVLRRLGRNGPGRQQRWDRRLERSEWFRNGPRLNRLIAAARTGEPLAVLMSLGCGSVDGGWSAVKHWLRGRA